MLTLSVVEGEASQQTYGSSYSARLLGFFGLRPQNERRAHMPRQKRTASRRALMLSVSEASQQTYGSTFFHAPSMGGG